MTFLPNQRRPGEQLTTLLLLQDCEHGSKFDVVTLGADEARDALAARKALVLTPTVRRRFAGMFSEPIPSAT